MTKQNDKPRRVPKVRLSKPGKRCYQLRYHDPDTGKEVRLSTSTHDPEKADEEKADLEAKLRLNLEPTRRIATRGPGMLWGDFRQEYSRLKQWRSDNARESAETRLDVAERLVSPKRLRDMTKSETLARLQAELATTRSGHTVSSYLATVIAALNWAHKDMGWLPEPVKFKRAKTSDLETHKGRPITQAEFDLMLTACEKTCKQAPADWKFLLRGLWETGLRIAEALQVSWDIPGTIRPMRHHSGRIVLQIPAALQKSKKDTTAGTVPDFVKLLDSVPIDDRTGWVFNPTSLNGKKRLDDPKRVGRIISDIGRGAGVFVNESGKPASAHDIRRSFGQRLADAGVPPLLLQSIMRHSRLETTQRYYLKKDAAKESDQLAVFLGTQEPEETPEEESPEEAKPK